MNFEKQTENIKFPDIVKELQEMVEVDQEIRMRTPDEYDGIDYDEIHINRMKEIVAEIGWPTVSKVGKDGASNAWLLVQHADRDVEFQNYCLNLMKAEPVSEVEKINIAYLEDRVRVNQGKDQLYGTQFRQENNQHIPKDIEDLENVDVRRAEMGLGPLEEQIQLMYDRYPFK